MLYGAEDAVCSEINTKDINTVWAERTIVECQTVGAPSSRILKVNTPTKCTYTIIYMYYHIFSYCFVAGNYFVILGSCDRASLM